MWSAEVFNSGHGVVRGIRCFTVPDTTGLSTELQTGIKGKKRWGIDTGDNGVH